MSHTPMACPSGFKPELMVLETIVLWLHHGHIYLITHLSLSRLNHWLPGSKAHPEVVQGTAEFHHQITDPLLPQTDPVLHDATTLHTAVDMLDPQPPLMERLVDQVL